MNYRHAYHAGSFSDVFKHIILMQLIASLKRKSKPFCYIDTHAGRGSYDLTSLASGKTLEFLQGIQKVMACTVNAPTPWAIKDYQALVQAEGFPNYYPGSPAVARRCARDVDQLILNELVPGEYQSLKNLFRGDRQVAVHCRDGYEALNAFLPPKEKRGLIFIDPAYEKPDECKTIINALSEVIPKFPSGIYAIWYPIKDLKMLRDFGASIKRLQVKNNLDVLKIELYLYPKDAQFKIIGTGMMIINPPWQFKGSFIDTLKTLWQLLSVEGKGSYSIESI